ncbi:molecular chaperone HtpG [Methylovirgula sp. 4M-Z18]|uniref:molecular chaperone HtpG n=1 Tax=Methylovirgula sp. 4M-Z18 TaxID=2293567 RepID=UPI000E2F27B0|nr:molecular chaperone HtpG [Methylovirgula sp. 4M-Z18]RFB79150.1 molecular chaperone HtpG [Methylovirgula sp. 4M-Z18]
MTAAKSHAFQADVARLLQLMVHSVYSDRDIFLRELISNSADACEKLRYEAQANPGLAAEGPFVITVSLDKEARLLTVTDNGIGMSHDDLVMALGTIASSGTRAFLDRLSAEDAAKGAELIGQFGIGFYSAFMVADKVVVETRRAGYTEAWRWTSDGQGTYETEALAPIEALDRGTKVILHLNAQSDAYLEPNTVERIVREHSGAIAVPVELIDAPGAEPRRIIDGVALWTKPKSEITAEEYTEFYRELARQFDEPALTVHWRAEGRHEYSVLAFIPGSRPFDLFDPQRKGRAKLYVRRVLISQDADLLPGWLRFVRLVADSADLPLNVSREMVQQSAVFNAIRTGVTNRMLQELTKLAEHEPEKFAGIWDNFGAVLKEGLYEAPEKRDQLFKLARFTTTAGSEKRTLDQYVKDLRENQTAIYYLTGDDAKRLASSPQLEGFRARGIEVLLLSDPVDSFWVTTAAGFEGKPFKSITQGAADIKNVPLKEGEKAPESSGSEADVGKLLGFVKETLGDAVSDVRISDRLSESPVCLVAGEQGYDRQLERILASSQDKIFAAKPVLEINPTHALIAQLSKRLGEGADQEFISDAAWLLMDEARILDGDQPADAAAFATRLTRVMAKAFG